MITVHSSKFEGGMGIGTAAVAAVGLGICLAAGNRAGNAVCNKIVDIYDNVANTNNKASSNQQSAASSQQPATASNQQPATAGNQKPAAKNQTNP